MAELTAAGWHGKLPTLGDFATRRLDPAFIEVWDAWLSAGLATLRLQPDWLQAYLASPSWRFVLMPGAMPGRMGDQAWAGVLMPSVDRVGRYYPLTLAYPLPAPPSNSAEADSLWRWLTQLDDAAVDALHEDWGLEAFEVELTRIGVPAIPCAAMTEGVDSPAATVMAQASGLWRAGRRDRAYWYAEPVPTQPMLLDSNGLKESGLVAQLMGAHSR